MIDSGLITGHARVKDFSNIVLRLVLVSRLLLLRKHSYTTVLPLYHRNVAGDSLRTNLRPGLILKLC